MSEHEVHIAQFNIGKLKLPLDHPNNEEFVSSIERVNLLGEKAPGFVWRLQDETGYGATGVNAYDDTQIVVNFTVWETIQDLYNFTYRGDHLEIFKRRQEWFESHDTNSLVLWWIPSGKIPTLEEAKASWEYLRKNGPTPHAFTFRQQFEPGGSE